MREVTANYVQAGMGKCELPVYKLLLLGFLSGVIIAMSATVSSTAAHSFTGNCLLFIPALEGKIRWSAVFRNWTFVYAANFAGAAAVAAGCALSGQLNYSNGGLAVYTIFPLLCGPAFSTCSGKNSEARAKVYGNL
jgi:formate/nitrite transporter FocA (FNT family)